MRLVQLLFLCDIKQPLHLFQSLAMAIVGEGFRCNVADLLKQLLSGALCCKSRINASSRRIQKIRTASDAMSISFERSRVRLIGNMTL